MMIIQVPLLNLAITHRSFCLRYRTTLRFDFIHTIMYVNLLFDGLCKNLGSDYTQNPGFSGFSIVHTYVYKTKRQVMKRKQRKMTFFVNY